jgi:hypothetical protein
MTLTQEKANWIDLINESVHTSDDVDPILAGEDEEIRDSVTFTARVIS